MKKMFLFISLTLFVSVANAQWWDELSRFDDVKMSSYGNEYTLSHKCVREIRIVDGHYVKYGYSDFVEKIQIPRQIYSDYVVGKRCFKSGTALIIIGSLSTIIGGCLYAGGMNNDNIDAIEIGKGFMIGGSTLVGISIPLMCFGDNMKRATNREYKIYKKSLY